MEVFWFTLSVRVFQFFPLSFVVFVLFLFLSWGHLGFWFSDRHLNYASGSFGTASGPGASCSTFSSMSVGVFFSESNSAPRCRVSVAEAVRPVFMYFEGPRQGMGPGRPLVREPSLWVESVLGEKCRGGRETAEFVCTEWKRIGVQYAKGESFQKDAFERLVGHEESPWIDQTTGLRNSARETVAVKGAIWPMSGGRISMAGEDLNPVPLAAISEEVGAMVDRPWWYSTSRLGEGTQHSRRWFVQRPFVAVRTSAVTTCGETVEVKDAEADPGGKGV